MRADDIGAIHQQGQRPPAIQPLPKKQTTATPTVATASPARGAGRRASHPPVTTATPKKMKVVVRAPISLASEEMFDSIASG